MTDNQITRRLIELIARNAAVAGATAALKSLPHCTARDIDAIGERVARRTLDDIGDVRLEFKTRQEADNVRS